MYRNCDVWRKILAMLQRHQKQGLSDDEDCLSKFLSLSEQSKEAFMDSYQVKSGELLTQLHVAWDVDFEFKGNYLSDYRLINNDLIEERTAWKDKYSSILYSPSSTITCRRGELQPVPDIPRWIKTHELHYMPWQEAALLEHGPHTRIICAYEDIGSLLLSDSKSITRYGSAHCSVSLGSSK